MQAVFPRLIARKAYVVEFWQPCLLIYVEVLNLLEATDDLPEVEGVSRSKAAAPGTLLEAPKRGR